MGETPHTSRCFLCQQKIKLGPHRYEGRNIPAWGILICNNCRRANHDGIVPSTYPHLIKHLDDQNIDYQLNAEGWIDIPT